jgi:hypothetical protein
MKSCIALAAFALTFGNVTTAQVFQDGSNLLGAGLGVGGGYGIGFSGSGVSQSPALALHLDHGMGALGPGTWGLGGFVGYKGISYTYDNFTPGGRYTSRYRWTYVVVGARGTWHYNEWHGNPKLDTYGGLLLAYRAASFKDETNYPNGVGRFNAGTYSAVWLNALLGARYMFSDKFGAYGELGFGVSVLQLGLAVKL